MAELSWHNAVIPNRTSKSGSEPFMIDDGDEDWKALRCLHDWRQISKAIGVAAILAAIREITDFDQARTGNCS